jgi:NAD(P)-dependent dehydrogenase (short-subunit alcohol dehydrogenase family)
VIKGQVIVTEASRGVGEAIATQLDRRGFEVLALSRSGQSAVGLAVVCDMTEEASIVRAIASIGVRRPIIGLVNNAGAHEARASAELSLSEFEACMRLNASAVLVASSEAYPHLRSCASKAAVGAIIPCLAFEWAKDGIRVLDGAPGHIETERDFLASDEIKTWLKRRVPVGRPGTAGEVTRLVDALLSEKIALLTGETISIDGGQGTNL